MYSLAFLTLIFSPALALAANNTGGAGSFSQQPSTSAPAANPSAPAPAGPINGSETSVRRGAPANTETEMQRSTATEIIFLAGTNQLTTETQGKLDELMLSARRRGQIDQVKVVSWGDISYPPAGAAKVPQSQKALAEGRGKSISSYLESKNSGVSVQSYNMAERPSALQELFNTSEARVKTSLENAGLAGPNVNRGSRSMVLVIVR